MSPSTLDVEVRRLRAMMLIREFERSLLTLERPGFQLLSSGEEAVAVGLCEALRPEDQLLSSGRAIGPALARGLDPGQVMAELLGKVDGPCRGRAGRGHLAQPSRGFFGAHAVVAGNLTIAAGAALAAQLSGGGRVIACIFGDGACGQGALHEALNIAALWRLPLVFVCDNNQYSVSTRVDQALAPRPLSALAGPFGIPGCTVDGMDVGAVAAATAEAVSRARAGEGPSFVECLTFGFYAHSTASRECRPRAEIDAWKARCPIVRLATRLEAEGTLPAAERAKLELEVAGAVERAMIFAQGSPDPDPMEALADVD